MVLVCLPSDALSQHLPSYLGFSYLGRGASLHGCSSKAQPLLLTLEEGYLLTAAPPDKTAAMGESGSVHESVDKQDCRLVSLLMPLVFLYVPNLFPLQICQMTILDFFFLSPQTLSPPSFLVSADPSFLFHQKNVSSLMRMFQSLIMSCAPMCFALL